MNAESILITTVAPNHACHEFHTLPDPALVTAEEIADALADVAVRVKMRRD